MAFNEVHEGFSKGRFIVTLVKYGESRCLSFAALLSLTGKRLLAKKRHLLADKKYLKLTTIDPLSSRPICRISQIITSKKFPVIILQVKSLE